MNQRLLEAAKRYAAYDKSDPFALARAKTHILSGIANHYNTNGQEAFYNADEYTETRSYTDGKGRVVEYQVPAYRNMIRP